MRIDTARLTLRVHTVADFADVAALWANPLVAGPIGLAPSTPAESWLRLLRYGGLWPLLGYGYWVVRRRADDVYVGELGFADFHRPIEPSLADIPEAGWVLTPDSQGQGYATEAMMAALAWLDARHPQCVCLMGPDNARSLRLARRVGFGVPAPALLHGAAALVLRRRAGSGEQAAGDGDDAQRLGPQGEGG